jgi:hypothetical protein
MERVCWQPAAGHPGARPGVAGDRPSPLPHYVSTGQYVTARLARRAPSSRACTHFICKDAHLDSRRQHLAHTQGDFQGPRGLKAEGALKKKENKATYSAFSI